MNDDLIYRDLPLPSQLLTHLADLAYYNKESVGQFMVDVLRKAAEDPASFGKVAAPDLDEDKE
jgi:hypothetical protein